MNYLEILKFRHACKIFDESKKISAGEFDFILEAGRLSPSSTGLEQWDFFGRAKQGAQRKDKSRFVEPSANHFLLAFGCHLSKDQRDKIWQQLCG